jgi:hypothetical protein
VLGAHRKKPENESKFIIKRTRGGKAFTDYQDTNCTAGEKFPAILSISFLSFSLLTLNQQKERERKKRASMRNVHHVPQCTLSSTPLLLDARFLPLLSIILRMNMWRVELTADGNYLSLTDSER